MEFVFMQELNCSLHELVCQEGHKLNVVGVFFAAVIVVVASRLCHLH